MQLTPLEAAAERVRYWRTRQLAADAGATSISWKLTGAVSELRDVAARGELSQAKFRAIVRLSFRLARRDYQMLASAGARGARPR
jgi:hypothetical protein